MLLASACGGHHAATAPLPGNGAVATTTLDHVWILGNSGPGFADTSVTFAQAAGRTVVLRQPGPDHAIFATVTFAARSDSTQTGDSTRIAIRQHPGEYALTLTADGDVSRGSTIVFTYPIHFQTPPGALAKYPNPVLLEAQLTPALLRTDGQVDIFPATRPADDMLRFAIPGPGSYAVVFAK